ncbi:MAG: PKD domain-containing protein [Candidatus Poseidoniaceae archaeon]|jgi:hypothetical protein|nr:PKD domain-containing protein [Candidatus Poseidoniaceae archaeon]
MGRAVLCAILLLATATLPSIAATSGRSPPQCETIDISAISGQTGIDAGACVIINLGTHTHQTVLDFDFTVSLNPLDVLLFDQNSIQSYNNGQSYRSSFVAEASFEDFQDSMQFDWAPPVSISAKTWYLVFDNLNHSGDAGQGSQGIASSAFSVDVSIDQGPDFPLVHDTWLFSAGERNQLAFFNVDGGTILDLDLTRISGSGELFVQSESQLGGNSFLADSKLEISNTDKQFQWTVPNSQDGQNLHLMVDSGVSSTFHFSLESGFTPVVQIVVNDNSNSTVNIGQEIFLDVYSSPNGMNQIVDVNWDFDNDGIIDSNGFDTVTMWSTPGVKSLSVEIISFTGETDSTIYNVNVIDNMAPVPVISGEGSRGLNGEWRLLRTSDLILSALNSADDHTIANTTWYVDGEQFSIGSQITLSWSLIGTHEVELEVRDPSGNNASVNTTIVVYDNTNPNLETTWLSEIEEVANKESVELRVSGSDAWDDESTLIYHWDFDLETDDDGDGDSRNDPDLVGEKVVHKFTGLGEHKIAVTVFDQSGNFDMEIITVNVVEPEDSGTIIGIIAITVFVLLLVLGLVVFGQRAINRRGAVQLLISNGLPLNEAISRVSEIIKTQNVPRFASAAQLAGITEGGQIKTQAQLVAEAKAEEIAAIYGDDGNELGLDPNAGFRPSFQQRQIDPKIAEAALAAFEEVNPQPKPVQQKLGRVKSGGVSIPESPKSKPQVKSPVSSIQSHGLQGECSACGKPYSMQIPENINNAVVACPNCGADQYFER